MMIRNALTFAALALAASTAPLAAQQPQPPAPAKAAAQPQDTARPKTAREIVFSKLRAISQSEVRDTTKKDSLANPVERTGALNVSSRTPTAEKQPAQPSMDFPRDSIMDELAKLENLEATQYRGSSAVFRSDSNTLVLFGKTDQKAGVVRDGQQMVADSLLTFDQTNSVACGFGKPVLSGGAAASPVESQEVCYDTRNKIGMAKGARTQVSEGGNWFVNGDLYYKGGDLYGHDGSFTDCSLPYPHYHFSAGEVKVINKDVMVARNVTLNFGDVPVFWLPFFMQSMKTGRRSGILMPQFSINDIVRRNSRYNRRISNVGFYWAISDMLGSRVALDWWANNYTALEGSFDYNLTNKFMNGGATIKRFWRDNGTKEFSLAAQHAWAPNERTNINMNAQYVSSTQLVRQSSFDPNELKRQIASTAGLSRRFDWGSLSMQADRRQDISSGRVDYTLPSLGVNFSTVTLFPAAGEAKWYNNGTWTSNAQVRRTGTALTTSKFDPSTLTGNLGSSLSFGKISFSQSFDANQGRAEARRAGPDSIFLLTTRQLAWNTSLNLQQRLIGTTTFTPGISMSQKLVSSDTVGGNALLKAPLSLNVNASLKADIFGFLPGIGPMERLRHRISPTITYTYSPKATIDPTDSLRYRVFGTSLGGVRERNTISIGLQQTIEGKYKEDSKADSLSADSAAIDSASVDPTKPRRLPQARKVSILSLGTDAVVYDFAAAKAGEEGVQTTQISNTINSDLLRGLQLTITHDLFKPDPTGGTTKGKREFSPFLTRASTSFSLSNNSWLFRFLGLGRKVDAAPPSGSQQTPTAKDAVGGVQPTGVNQPEMGVIGTRSTETAPPPRGAMGSWSANFNLTIERARHDTTSTLVQSLNNSMVQSQVTFQPTQEWNVTWSTSYSFTSKHFTDHILTFTRQMHDWDANFNFVKAQNGNFSFLFNVRLRANPDIKFDYNQHSNVANSQNR